MTRPSAPERDRTPGHGTRSVSAEQRRKHLELARARQAARHSRVVNDNPPPPPPPPRRPWARFSAHFGWRAYALPLLVVITVVALFTTNNAAVRHAVIGAPSPKASTPPTAAPTGSLASDNPTGAGVGNNEALASDALPAGGPYTVQGAGTFGTIPGTSGVFGSGPLKKFDIEVENGVTGIDLTAFAKTVMQTLTNPQSWVGGKNVSLQRVDSGPVDFEITLTSSMTVRQLCGYDIQIETSCFAPDHDNRVVLNVARWVRGDNAYFLQLAQYRIYMVNHEVGHALGHVHAHQCLADGLAPAMMQQTIGLKTASGQVCQRNPWPYPPGATDAPGAEQGDPSADQSFVNQNS